jgi:hypothetical protein
MIERLEENEGFCDTSLLRHGPRLAQHSSQSPLEFWQLASCIDDRESSLGLEIWVYNLYGCYQKPPFGVILF